MKVESIAECSLGAFCNTFDLHYAIIGLVKKTFFRFLSGLLRQVLLYTIKLSLMSIQFEKLKKKKNSDRPTHTRKTGLGKGKQKYF